MTSLPLDDDVTTLADAARECVVTFQDMDRLPSVFNYYYRCHKTPLLQIWSEFAASSTTVSWLPLFYEKLAVVWRTEVGRGTRVCRGTRVRDPCTLALITSYRGP